MIGDIASQRAYVRRGVGHGEDTALVSDDLLDDALEDALRRVNDGFPLIGVGSFQTVVDQQEYSIVPADGSTLRTVYWPQECEYVFPQRFGRYIEMLSLTEPVDDLGTRRMIEPSIVIAFQQQQEFFRRMYGEGGMILNGVTTYLDPIPSQVVTVYFQYNAKRFALSTDVDDRHTAAYYCAALVHVHQALSAGRGGLTSVSSAGGVGMTTRAAEHHLTLSERKNKEFIGHLPLIPPIRKW